MQESRVHFPNLEYWTHIFYLATSQFTQPTTLLRPTWQRESICRNKTDIGDKQYRYFPYSTKGTRTSQSRAPDDTLIDNERTEMQEISQSMHTHWECCNDNRTFQIGRLKMMILCFVLQRRRLGNPARKLKKIEEDAFRKNLSSVL